MASKPKKLQWLDEFEHLANEVLGEQDTSACDQIHPLVRDWYDETINDDFPPSRDAVMQAMACLTTEIMADIPENIFQVLSSSLDEEEVAVWLFEVLMLGRGFEQSLNSGRLDDL
jgi:hypothetical protein